MATRTTAGLLLSLALAGCGDSGSKLTAASTATTAAVVTPTPAPVATPAPTTTTGVADFTTLDLASLANYASPVLPAY